MEFTEIEDPRECVSLGTTNISTMRAYCRQFMVNEYFLDSLIIIEKVLPKSAYTGYARPVRYAPFMNLIDPCMRAKEWKWMSEDQRNGYKCLVGHFEALFRTVFNSIGFYKRFGFLYTDVKNYAQVYLHRPHLDMSMEHYGSSKVKLGFMPLTKHGMFLEVLHPEKHLAQLVFI